MIQIIPFWKSFAKLLFQVSEDDHNFDSALYGRIAADCLSKHGKPSSDWDVLLYPGAGHTLNVPYTPVASHALHPLAPKGARVYMGGGDFPRQHHEATVKSYNDAVRFFRNSL